MLILDNNKGVHKLVCICTCTRICKLCLTCNCEWLPFLQVFDLLHGNVEDFNGVEVLPLLLHPKSRGVLKLKSTDPLDKPTIDPRYLEDSQDVKVMVDGMKFVMHIISHKISYIVQATCTCACVLYTKK